MKILMASVVLLFFFSCASDPYLVKKPYLYEVKKNEKLSYVFGSMHSGVHKSDLPEKFWDYVDQSSMVLSEVDFSDEQVSQKFESELAKRFILRNGEKKASEVYTPIEIEKIKTLIKKINPNLNESFIDIISAYGIYMTIVQNLDLSISGNINRGDVVRMKKKFILDQQIVDYAKSKDKYTKALDSITSEEFINCTIGKEEQLIKANKENLKRTSVNVTDITKIFKDYRDGDTKKLLVEINKLPTCVLAQRNNEWVRTIKPTFEYYPKAFVVVGVGHLIAEKDSLLQMLEKEGFSVRRIEELDGNKD